MNDKRKIDKFSNYILYTQRETWSNWWYTCRLKRHRHNSTVEDLKRDIFNRNQSPVFTWQFRFRRTTKMKNIQKVSRKTDEDNLYDRVKAPLTSSVYYYIHLSPLPANEKSFSHPSLSNNTLPSTLPSVLSTGRLHPHPSLSTNGVLTPIKWSKKWSKK